MNSKKKALGRGLSAILESPETDITSKDISGNFVAGAVASIPINQIETNPFQPRVDFEEEALNELAESIREQGIIQPLTVRKMGYDRYQLISGERRLRASQIAGLTDVPCYIRIANDVQVLEMALVENIQRENLNALEIAISYQRLIEECELTQEELSQRVGKNRSTITNYLRLLKLPAPIQLSLRDGRITMGHARALLGIENEVFQIDLMNDIIDNNLSVREIEERVKEQNKPVLVKKEQVKTEIPTELEKLSKSVCDKYKVKTSLRLNNKGKGSIVINFQSMKELERLLIQLNAPEF